MAEPTVEQLVAGLRDVLRQIEFYAASYQHRLETLRQRHVAESAVVKNDSAAFMTEVQSGVVSETAATLDLIASSLLSKLPFLEEFSGEGKRQFEKVSVG